MRTEEMNKISDDDIEKLFVSGEGSEEEIIDGTTGSLVDNSADKEQVEKAEKKLERREGQERQDVQWMLSDVRGRRILWKLLEKTKPFVSGFQPNNEALQYYSGHRDIGRDLFLEIMDADASAFGKMMTEFKGDSYASKKRRSKK